MPRYHVTLTPHVYGLPDTLTEEERQRLQVHLAAEIERATLVWLRANEAERRQLEAMHPARRAG